MEIDRTLIENCLSKLKDIRRRATMEGTIFKKQFKQFKEVTHNWRATWIIDPLDEIITALEKALEKK
jgi:hypothetical protein